MGLDIGNEIDYHNGKCPLVRYLIYNAECDNGKCSNSSIIIKVCNRDIIVL